MPLIKPLLAPPNPEDIPDMCPLARFMMETILEENNVPPPRVFTVDNIIRTIIDQYHNRCLALTTVVDDNQASSTPPRSPYQQTGDIQESFPVWGNDRINGNEPVVINQTLTCPSRNYGETRSRNLQFLINETPLDCTTNRRRTVDRFNITIPETQQFCNGANDPESTVNCDYLDDTRGRLRFKENEKSKPGQFEINNGNALIEMRPTKPFESENAEKENTQNIFFIPNSYFGNQYVNGINQNPYVTDGPQSQGREIIEKVQATKQLPNVGDLFLNRNIVQNNELIDLSKNINDLILGNDQNPSKAKEVQQPEEEDIKIVESVANNEFQKSGNLFLNPVQDHDEFLPQNYDDLNINPTKTAQHSNDNKIIETVSVRKYVGNDNLCFNRNYPVQNQDTLSDISKKILDPPMVNPNANTFWNKRCPQNENFEDGDTFVMNTPSVAKFVLRKKKVPDNKDSSTKIIMTNLDKSDTSKNAIMETVSVRKYVGNDNLCFNRNYPVQNQDTLSDISKKIVDPPMVNPNANTFWNKRCPQNENFEDGDTFVMNTPNVAKFVLRKKKVPDNEDGSTKIIMTSKNLDKSDSSKNASQLLNQNNNPKTLKLPLTQTLAAIDNWVDSSFFYDDENLLKQDGLKVRENVAHENFNVDFNEPNIKICKKTPKSTDSLKRPVKKLKREGYVLEISKENPGPQPKLFQSKLTDLLPVKKNVNIFKSEVVDAESDFQRNTLLIQNDSNVTDPINCSERKEKAATDNMLNRIVSNVQNKLQKFKFNNDEAKFDKNKKYGGSIGEEIKNSNANLNQKESTEDCRPGKEYFFEEKISNANPLQMNVEQEFSKNLKEKQFDDSTKATLSVISTNKEEKVMEKTFQDKKFTKIWQQNKSADRKPLITMSKTIDRLQTDEEMKRKFDEEVKNKNTVYKIKRAKFLTPVRRTIEKKD